MGRRGLIATAFALVLVAGVAVASVQSLAGCQVGCPPIHVPAVSFSIWDAPTGAPVLNPQVNASCKGNPVEVDLQGSFGYVGGHCTFALDVNAPRYLPQSREVYGQDSNGCGGDPQSIQFSLERAPDATTDGGVPRGDGGACLDSDLEPNDIPDSASALRSPQVDGSPLVLDGLAICSADDIDYYSFELPGAQGVDVDVDFDRFAGELLTTIFDAALQPRSRTTLTATGLSAGAYLSAGTFYVKVEPAPGTQPTSYRLSLLIYSH